MNYRFRVNDSGQLVLQVQEQSPDYDFYGGRRESVWRDAKVEDIPVSDPFGSQPVWPQVLQRGVE